MILYGRDLSPFVRRIAIWCALQDRKVERRPLMVSGEDFEKLKTMNPVGRVPILDLDDGTRLVDSYMIGDWLDETSPNGVRLVPERGPARHEVLQRLAIGAGTAEKAVALIYEKNRRPEELHWKTWQDRLIGQVHGGLKALDDAAPAEGWSGDGPDAGDVAAVVAFQFIEAANPWLLEPGYPRLAALVERAMQNPAIAATKPDPV